MKLTLDAVQVKTLDYALKNPYSILGLDMGLGKSAVALATWEKTGGHLLVVCPAYLVLNWKNEIRKCLGDEVIVTVVKKGADIYQIWDTDIAIISYDLAQKAEQFFEWANMVVFDEGQELKSMQAKRTEFAHRVIFENSLPRVHILTGTPIVNRVKEYYSLLSMMHYSPKYGKSGSKFLDKFPDEITFADHFSHRQEFKMEMMTRKGPRWITVVKFEGFKNVPELKSYMKGHYIRFKSTLAEPRFKDILISENPDKRLLAEFDCYFDEEENQGVNSSAKAAAALQKVKFTSQYARNILEEGVGCVPIYTDHIDACEALAEEFGVRPLTGKVPASVRFRAVEDFMAGKTDVLCATMGAMSTGFSLVRAWNMILNDIPWKPGTLDQTIARIRRHGQTKRCVIHRILGTPADRYIMDVVEAKRKTIEAVT